MLFGTISCPWLLASGCLPTTLLPGRHELGSFLPPRLSATMSLPWSKLTMNWKLWNHKLIYIFLPLYCYYQAVLVIVFKSSLRQTSYATKSFHRIQFMFHFTCLHAKQRICWQYCTCFRKKKKGFGTLLHVLIIESKFLKQLGNSDLLSPRFILKGKWAMLGK